MYERASSILFQYIVSILRVLVVFWCVDLWNVVHYKEKTVYDLTIFTFFSWETALNVFLEASFDNM
jgi:hypothetical protein